MFSGSGRRSISQIPAMRREFPATERLSRAFFWQTSRRFFPRTGARIFPCVRETKLPRWFARQRNRMPPSVFITLESGEGVGVASFSKDLKADNCCCEGQQAGRKNCVATFADNFPGGKGYQARAGPGMNNQSGSLD